MPAQSARLSAPAPTPELNRLLAGDHPDPHQILGLHDGHVVAYRPDARAMQVVLPAGEHLEMQRIRDEGVFVAEVRDAGDGYRLRAEFPDGEADEFSDP